MNLELNWVNPSQYDRVAEARMYCYGSAGADLERFKESFTLNRQLLPGDILLATRNGRPVGTATSLDLRMWVRGGVVPCQGVAWVGTVKTSRRASYNSNNKSSN